MTRPHAWSSANSLPTGSPWPTTAAGGGRRAAIVVITSGYGRQLQEVELPSRRVLRSVDLALPVFGTGELVAATAFSGWAILVSIGKGGGQRTRL